MLRLSPEALHPTRGEPISDPSGSRGARRPSTGPRSSAGGALVVENRFENHRSLLIRLMCRSPATISGSRVRNSKGALRTSQVEGLLRDNRVEVRVLFGAFEKALQPRGFRRPG